jgi:serine/threonine protein kinase
MEFAGSETLHDRLKTGVAIPRQQAFDWLRQLSIGLHHLHDHNVVHLDLKPANVAILVEDGRDVLRLIDFDTSRVPKDPKGTDPTERIGTKGYGPPELFSGALLTAASDIYSFCVMACEVLNGQKSDVPPTVQRYVEAMRGCRDIPREVCDAITQRFKGTTPIYNDVSTERRYAQVGCSRLKVRFWQDGVQLPGVPAPRRQTIDFGINYCRDGLPPKSLN